MKTSALFWIMLLFCFTASAQQNQPLFVKTDPAITGVQFINNVVENDSLHVMKYEYLYNGHGVGVADFNQDGLPDLFISGNMVSPKLFLNLGGMKFRDITSESGIRYNGTWATGVSIADVNNDGFPDIYLCHSGSYTDSLKLKNELFIHKGIQNGIPVFAEEAGKYRLDAPGTQSTQAAFFDYDLDGDLDMFLLNHSNHSYNPFLNTKKQRSTPDLRFGNRLFRNDRNAQGAIEFTDVTFQAGIINNALNFGLSVTISDINNDGYPDIYTTSDYTEKDCYYVNNRNGTFTESLEASFSHISKYSMGADIADYNNDGLVDVYTLDMLPEDNYRQKLLKGPDEYDQYHLLLDSGYYHQQMRNMLHLNQGADRTGRIRFSEIGQMAGVSNTDWSWAGLFADFDNDGWKDLFVTNGYLRDFTDLDFLKYTVSNVQLEQAKKGNFDFKTFNLVKQMPSNKLSSYMFRNRGDLLFDDVTTNWGLLDPAISNGAAYADLDNDGDLDLIVCRNNEPVAIFQNNSSLITGNRQISIRFKPGKRTAYGTKVYVYTKGLSQMQENYPVRGYQSSVSQDLFFGIGKADKADSIRVVLPGGKYAVYYDLPAGTLVNLDLDSVQSTLPAAAKPQYIFTDYTKQSGLNFRHRENDFIDFKDEVLLPYKLSTAGPALAKADVNGDGLEDVFIGGAIEQASALYLQQKNGNFILSPSQPWIADQVSEDVNAVFFDANSDGFPDLYVVSGGNEYGEGSPEYADRLYLNSGTGTFIKIADALPTMLSNKHAIASADFDNDGDPDLFIGGRGVPGSFPLASRSYILRNDSRAGKIKFTDVTELVNKELLLPGMVTIAQWADLDKDGFPELLIGGDWMPLMLFKNNQETLTEISATAGLAKTGGIWSAITADDIDGDGDLDFVVGNAGTNLQFRARPDKPATMHAADFDNNGRIDPIISYYIRDKSYPAASRDEILEQMTGLRKKFIYYKDYANVQAKDIFSQKQLSRANVYTCEMLESVVLINKGDLSFEIKPLEVPAQVSRINGIITEDLDNDGIKDILIAGNDYSYRVQYGRSDASFGLFMKGKGNGAYSVIQPRDSGLFVSGDVRNFRLVKGGDSRFLIFAKNNDEVQIEKIK